jgi:hypothetical protein
MPGAPLHLAAFRPRVHLQLARNEARYAYERGYTPAEFVRKFDAKAPVPSAVPKEKQLSKPENVAFGGVKIRDPQVLD